MTKSKRSEDEADARFAGRVSDLIARLHRDRHAPLDDAASDEANTAAGLFGLEQIAIGAIAGQTASEARDSGAREGLLIIGALRLGVPHPIWRYTKGARPSNRPSPNVATRHARAIAVGAAWAYRLSAGCTDAQARARVAEVLKDREHTISGDLIAKWAERRLPRDRGLPWTLGLQFALLAGASIDPSPAGISGQFVPREMTGDPKAILQLALHFFRATSDPPRRRQSDISPPVMSEE